MTVEAAEEMWSKTKLVYSTPDGYRNKIKITKGFSVVTDKDDKIEDVLEAQDLPQLLDLYPDSDQIRVQSVEPTKISPIYYIVLVTYVGESASTSFATTPVDAAPTIRWKNLQSEEEVDEAFDDTSDTIVSIATVNGEPVHGITDTITDLVAVVERNYSYGAFDLPTLHKYLHSTNSDPIVTNFGTFPPGLAKLTKFEPTEIAPESDTGYVKVNAEVTFRWPYGLDPSEYHKAWWKRYLHEGYIMRVRDAAYTEDDDSEEAKATDRLVNISEGNGDRSVSPLHLNERGFAIADPTDPNTPPHYRKQRRVYQMPYAALGLF